MYLYVVNGFRGHAIQRVLYVPSVKDDLKIQLYLFITIVSILDSVCFNRNGNISNF